jgi:K+-sensing histidine kinase KdpD/ActR/RegA family two-component response regulator
MTELPDFSISKSMNQRTSWAIAGLSFSTFITFCVSHLITSKKYMDLNAEIRRHKVVAVFSQYFSAIESDLILRQQTSLQRHLIDLNMSLANSLEPNHFCAELVPNNKELLNWVHSAPDLSSITGSNNKLCMPTPTRGETISLESPEKIAALKIVILDGSPGQDERLSPSLVFAIAWSVISAIICFRFMRKKVLEPIGTIIANDAKQQSKNTTLRMLAHDIRRPFAMMNLVIQKLDQATSLQDIKNYYLTHKDTIKRSIAEASSSIQNMLEDTLNDKLKSERSNIKNCLETASERIAVLRNWPKTRLTFEGCLPSNLHVSMPPENLIRIIENLLQNADEASPSPKVIKISLIEDQNHATLSIWNAGATINVPRGHDIFSENFSQNKQSGHGIGLAIVKQFTNAVGGSISWTNDNGGVRFELTLPILNKQLPMDNHVLCSNSKRILIIEDEVIFQDEIIRSITANAADFSDAIIDCTESFEEAINASLRNTYALVICDIHIDHRPVCAAIDAIISLRELNKSAIFIIQSNSLLSPSDLKSLKHNDIDVYTKPMSMIDLKQSVHKPKWTALSIDSNSH